LQPQERQELQPHLFHELQPQELQPQPLRPLDQPVPSQPTEEVVPEPQIVQPHLFHELQPQELQPHLFHELQPQELQPQPLRVLPQELQEELPHSKESKPQPHPQLLRQLQELQLKHILLYLFFRICKAKVFPLAFILHSMRQRKYELPAFLFGIFKVYKELV